MAEKIIKTLYCLTEDEIKMLSPGTGKSDLPGSQENIYQENINNNNNRKSRKKYALIAAFAALVVVGSCAVIAFSANSKSSVDNDNAAVKNSMLSSSEKINLSSEDENAGADTEGQDEISLNKDAKSSSSQPDKTENSKNKVSQVSVKTESSQKKTSTQSSVSSSETAPSVEQTSVYSAETIASRPETSVNNTYSSVSPVSSQLSDDTKKQVSDPQKEKSKKTDNSEKSETENPDPEPKPSEVSLTSISISSMPSKTTYQIGESLDISGLKVSGNYSDGSSKIISGSDISINGFDSDSAGQKTLTISCFGKSTSFAVTVEENNNVLSSGKCGDNLSYTITDDGILTISGTGEMWDGGSSSLFGDSSDSISECVIENGVTSIGAQSFIGIKFNKISIPSTVNKIGRGAFSNSNIESLIIPDGITEIEDSLCYHCNNLKSVYLPEGVTEIGRDAFCICSSLSEIKLPTSLGVIREGAFNQAALETLYIPENVSIIEDTSLSMDTINLFNVASGNKYFSSKDGVLFNKNMTEIIVFPANSSLTSYSIPDGVVTIHFAAFCDCNNLSSIQLPDSVTTICENAFIGCKALKSITIPESVTSIDPNAFAECYNIDNDRYDLVIYCRSGSYAKSFAEQNNIPFEIY